VVGDNVAAIVEAGGIGINLEDGTDAPELLSEKIIAAKEAAARVDREVFINARTDVYLRNLVPSERAVAETIARGQRFQAAGCDSLFVPGLIEPDDIAKVVQAFDLPINLLLWPSLPAIPELRRLGVRRLSVGASLTRLAYETIRRAATELLQDGSYDALSSGTLNARELNQLMAQVSAHK
jgi:2-methylisocitrate lyase-like PEP mutase family enzyme